MAEKRKKEKWVDDGRVIANMNVEGMRGAVFPRNRRKRFDEFGEVPKKPEPIELTRKERRAISRGVSLAFIAVLLIFVALLTLIMIFCSQVWFS